VVSPVSENSAGVKSNMLLVLPRQPTPYQINMTFNLFLTGTILDWMSLRSHQPQLMQQTVADYQSWLCGNAITPEFA